MADRYARSEYNPRSNNYNYRQYYPVKPTHERETFSPERPDRNDLSGYYIHYDTRNSQRASPPQARSPKYSVPSSPSDYNRATTITTLVRSNQYTDRRGPGPRSLGHLPSRTEDIMSTMPQTWLQQSPSQPEFPIDQSSSSRSSLSYNEHVQQSEYFQRKITTIPNRASDQSFEFEVNGGSFSPKSAASPLPISIIRPEAMGEADQQAPKRSQPNVALTMGAAARVLQKGPYAGLENHGNTCYMSAVFQCLRFSPTFYNMCTNKASLEVAGRSKLFVALSNLLRDMANKGCLDMLYRDVESIRTALKPTAPLYVGTEQQDAVEFLVCLLETLHSEIKDLEPLLPQPTFPMPLPDETDNKAVLVTNKKNKTSNGQVDKVKSHLKIKDWFKRLKSRKSSKGNGPPVMATHIAKLPDEEVHPAVKAWKDELKSESSSIKRTFMGQMQTYRKCQKCKHEFVSYGVVWNLSVPIPCLTPILNDVPISNGGVANNTQLKKSSILYDGSATGENADMLRFHYGSRGVKKDVNVDFGMTLDMREHTISDYKRGCVLSESAPTMNDHIYWLFGVVYHEGSTNFGHYTAACRIATTEPDGMDDWYYFDDELVKKIKSSDVNRRSAYLLFYERDHLYKQRKTEAKSHAAQLNARIEPGQSSVPLTNGHAPTPD